MGPPLTVPHSSARLLDPGSAITRAPGRPMPRTPALSARGRLNALQRHRPADDPAVAEAVRDLAATRAVEHLREAVAASRAAQGLPPTVTDPATLERVAAVLRLAAVAAQDSAGPGDAA